MREIMSPSELAELLGVSEATLTDWRYRRRGPEFVRVGRLIRYTSDAVVDWIAQRTVETDTELASDRD